MHIHVIFNPNQEKNLLGYKVVDYSKNLNGVCNHDLGNKSKFYMLTRACFSYPTGYKFCSSKGGYSLELSGRIPGPRHEIYS